MFQQMKKRIKNEKGLTLIELLAVIVILAIIAAIAIPAIGNIISNQRDKAILADISGVISAAKIAHADGACGTDNVCEQGEISDHVSAKGFKNTNDKVTLTDATDPEIVYTLDAKEVFKVNGKIAKKLTDKKVNSTGTITIKESVLNEIMGK